MGPALSRMKTFPHLRRHLSYEPHSVAGYYSKRNYDHNIAEPRTTAVTLQVSHIEGGNTVIIMDNNMRNG